MKRIRYIVISLFIFSFSYVQNLHELDLKASQIRINGTSSLQDWESIVTEFNGTAGFTLEGNKIVKAEDIVLRVDVKSIQSGKSLMDKKIMEALKQSKYQSIILKSKESVCLENQQIKYKGNLQIAGASREVTAMVGYKLVKGMPVCSGSINFLMTDYEIEPPVALFGSIKTGDEIKIDFVFEYNENNKISNNLNK